MVAVCLAARSVANRSPPACLLTAFGQWQCVGAGEHAVTFATKLIDDSDLLQGLASRRRDFR